MSLSSEAGQLLESLAKGKLVPGSASILVPSSFKPTTKVYISFSDKAVELGTFFRAGECKTAPSISFKTEVDASPKTSYTLVLVDPDAPTPDDPKFAFWRHWVLVGLQPLSDGSGTAAQTKPALTAYLGPGPKDESKPHRYLFLLYREPEGMDLAKKDVGGEEFTERRSFNLAEFVEKQRLQLVGVNWMTCAGDGWKE